MVEQPQAASRTATPQRHRAGVIAMKTQAAFLSSLPEKLRDELEAAPQLQGLLEEVERCCAGSSWAISAVDLASQLARTLPASLPTPGALPQLHVADVHLALACAQGLPAAT